MDTPERIRFFYRGSTPPLLPQSFKEKVLRGTREKNAWNDLSNYFHEDDLWVFLSISAQAKKEFKDKGSRKFRLSDSPPYAIARFQRRVHRMAEEIDGLNEKIVGLELILNSLPIYLLKPLTDEIISFDSVKSLEDYNDVLILRKLTKLMRMYADFIGAYDLINRDFFRKAVAETMQLPLLFMHKAKTQYGKYFARQFATLLEAAYAAVGVHAEVDPRNLKLQYSRSRKK
jgi:hypothetical protein